MLIEEEEAKITIQIRCSCKKNGKHRAMKQSGSLHIPITFGEKIIFPIKMYHSVFEHCLPLVLYSLDLFPQKRAISIYNYPQKGMMTQ